MKRVDEYSVPDTGDHLLVCGIVLFKGKLQWAEGSKRVADDLLNAEFLVPDDRGGLKHICGLHHPQLWLEWAPFRLSNAYSYVTEPYEDDDGHYDPTTGIFIGDENNPPLPTDEEMDTIENDAIACTDTASVQRMQIDVTTLQDKPGGSVSQHEKS